MQIQKRRQEHVVVPLPHQCILRVWGGLPRIMAGSQRGDQYLQNSFLVLVQPLKVPMDPPGAVALPGSGLSTW